MSETTNEIHTQYSYKNYPQMNSHLKYNRYNNIGHNSKNYRSHLKCDFCGLNGHNYENCRKRLKCDFCGLNGHYINMCQKKRSIQDKKDATYGFPSKAHHTNLQESNSNTRTPSHNLTYAQYHELLTLLNQAKSGSMVRQMTTSSGNISCANVFHSETHWILDTGATDHMVCSQNLMSSSIPVTIRHVHLPDHSLVHVTHIGTVHFSNNFILHNVLCVPSFKLNLVSIAKLTQTTLCHVTFTNNMCLVQDKCSGKTIGMGTEKAGLYYLTISKKAECFSISNTTPTNPHLWHQRLGHLSNNSLRELSLSINIPFCSISDCSICPLAKQTRNPFPLSSIKTKAPFELIHVDIWGSYHIPALNGARYFLTIVDDYSRCTWVYLLNTKSDTHTFLTTFINLVETQFAS